MKNILTADIGVTNSDFGHFRVDDQGALELIKTTWLATRNASSFGDLLQQLTSQDFPLAPDQAALAVFAAVIHATTPGLRFFHHGQLEGRRKKLPVQLGREPEEPGNPDFAAFYRKLLGLTRHPLFKEGIGSVSPVLPPIPGDQAHQPLVAFAYSLEDQRGVIVVNFSGQVASGFLKFPNDFWQGWQQITLRDEMGEPVTTFPRSEEKLEGQGLYVLLPPYEFHFLTASKGERT